MVPTVADCPAAKGGFATAPQVLNTPSTKYPTPIPMPAGVATVPWFFHRAREDPVCIGERGDDDVGERGSRRRWWRWRGRGWRGLDSPGTGASEIDFKVRISACGDSVPISRVIGIQATRCFPHIRHAIVVGVSRRRAACEEWPSVITPEASRTGMVFRDQTGIDRVSSGESGTDVIEDVLHICLGGRNGDGIAR